jgi:hypothetical protein
MIGALALGGVEDYVKAAVLGLDNLAFDQAAGSGDILGRDLLEVDRRGVEQQPAQRLLLGHGLRDVIDRGQAGRVRGVLPRLIECDVPDAVQPVGRVL